jgi:hypothetical protein
MKLNKLLNMKLKCKKSKNKTMKKLEFNRKKRIIKQKN